jgi:hypothetical protein
MITKKDGFFYWNEFKFLTLNNAEQYKSKIINKDFNKKMTNTLNKLPSGDYLFKKGIFEKINLKKEKLKVGCIKLIVKYNQENFKPYIHNFKNFEGCLIELWKMQEIFYKVYELKKEVLKNE